MCSSNVSHGTVQRSMIITQIKLSSVPQKYMFNFPQATYGKYSSRDKLMFYTWRCIPVSFSIFRLCLVPPICAVMIRICLFSSLGNDPTLSLWLRDCILGRSWPCPSSKKRSFVGKCHVSVLTLSLSKVKLRKCLFQKECSLIDIEAAII